MSVNKPKDYIKEAKEKLEEGNRALEIAHLMNDYLEVFYGTKNKPSEELRED